MALDNTLNTAKLIYLSIMEKIFLDDFNDPDIRNDIDVAIDEAIRITKKDILDDEISVPLPGKLAQRVIKQFCSNMILSLYPTEQELYNYINVKILSTDAYRYIYKNSEDYRFIIKNLDYDFNNIWKNNLSVNKKCTLFTFKEKVALFFTFITPFFPFGIIYLYNKIKNEKKAKAVFTDDKYYLILRFFKYSELLTNNLYKAEYSDYDIKFKNEVEIKNDLDQ